MDTFNPRKAVVAGVLAAMAALVVILLVDRLSVRRMLDELTEYLDKRDQFTQFLTERDEGEVSPEEVDQP